MNKHAAIGLIAAAILAGCSGGPPPADWKMNAFSLLEHAQQSWLEGDSKAAELALARSRAEIAKSGRPDLLARAELAACAARVASLDFAVCPAFDKLSADAMPADAAYAKLITGEWSGLDAKILPPHYAPLLASGEDASANRAVADIKDPLPRLIAAALLFKSARADPTTLGLAVETASERGWRRPLLAWLAVSLERARKAGDAISAERIQRRIDLVMGGSLTRP